MSGALVVAAALRVAATAQAPTADSLAARVDPYVEKSRVVVMTDIANEPDDQMSMVRFLVYANQYDVEGLIATTSTWMRKTVRPDVIQTLLDAYAQVQARLEQHEPGFPDGRGVAPAGRVRADGFRDGRGRRGQDAPPAPTSFSRRRRSPTRVRSGCWRGAARTRSRRRCCRRARRVRRTARRAGLEAARLCDLRSGRCRPVDSQRVPLAPLHRDAVAARRRAVLPRDLDRHQRRSVLQERARRRLHARSKRRGSTHTSGAKGRWASCTRSPAAFTKGTRRRSSA